MKCDSVSSHCRTRALGTCGCLGGPEPDTALGLCFPDCTAAAPGSDLVLLGQGRGHCGVLLQRETTPKGVPQPWSKPQAHLMPARGCPLCHPVTRPSDFHWALSIEWLPRSLVHAAQHCSTIFSVCRHLLTFAPPTDPIAQAYDQEFHGPSSNPVVASSLVT